MSDLEDQIVAVYVEHNALHHRLKALFRKYDEETGDAERRDALEVRCSQAAYERTLTALKSKLEEP